MKRLRATLKDLTAYPAAVVGLVIILALIGISIYTLISMPYDEAIRLWRGGEEVWYASPRNASPIWMNWFRRDKLPTTILVSSRDAEVEKSTEVVSDVSKKISIAYTFDYQFDDFPEEMNVFFDMKFEAKAPFITLIWLTPDGREIEVAEFRSKPSFNYRFAQDSTLARRLNELPPNQGLFADLTAEVPYLVRGTYTLIVNAFTFEEGSDIEADLVVYGQVHGLAGTDHKRRDLMIALLWGTPIALTFGLLAAVGTTITTMTISGIGTWFGGWVDEIIQRITEVNLILPVLPILIMIGTFYSKSIWLMLSVLILLSIFGGSIKTYRAVFLQVKESPYVEAARAYGASNLRIIFTYLVPRIIPMLLPNLVVLIPSYVFIEAALAVLGLGDPTLPTWGKVINEARVNGALYKGLYYWMLEPSVLLMMTGLAFSLLGFSLDRIFNPKLRGL